MDFKGIPFYNLQKEFAIPEPTPSHTQRGLRTRFDGFDPPGLVSSVNQTRRIVMLLPLKGSGIVMVTTLKCLFLELGRRALHSTNKQPNPLMVMSNLSDKKSPAKT